jgi:type VI protein secretion system component Hcp
MYRQVAIALLVVTGLTAASVVHADEFKLLMWIEGISGPEDQPRNWIEVSNFIHQIPDLPAMTQLMQSFPTELSCSHRPAAGAAARAARITKRVDQTSPLLEKACREGSVIPRMRLALMSPTSQRAIGMNFEEIKVTYMAVHAPGFGDRDGVTMIPQDRPMIELGIDFEHVLASIEWYPR